MSANREEQSSQAVIVIEEERLRERFTQIPNTILRRPDVTPGAKLTYVMLLSYAWQDDSCFPGQQTLAQDIGVSRRSVVTYLQELQDKGLLLVKRRGLGQTNVYTLTRWDTSRSAESAHQEVQKTAHQEVQILHANKTQKNKTQSKKTHISSNSFDGFANLQQAGNSKFFESATRRRKTDRQKDRSTSNQDRPSPTRSDLEVEPERRRNG